MVDSPRTTEGDSGMLWSSMSGQAVAVHAGSSVDLGNNRTQYSFGMFAHRFKKILDVEFFGYVILHIYHCDSFKQSHKKIEP